MSKPTTEELGLTQCYCGAQFTTYKELREHPCKPNEDSCGHKGQDDNGICDGCQPVLEDSIGEFVRDMTEVGKIYSKSEIRGRLENLLKEETEKAVNIRLLSYKTVETLAKNKETIRLKKKILSLVGKTTEHHHDHIDACTCIEDIKKEIERL